MTAQGSTEPLPAKGIPKLNLIWAQAELGAFGNGGAIPWTVPEDLEHFRQVTTGHTVAMGRSTWESLPATVRPLPDRRNVVVSRRPGYTAPGAEVFVAIAQLVAEPGPVWVIGGAKLLTACLPSAGRALITQIDVKVPADTYAPELGLGWALRSRQPWRRSQSGLRYRINEWRRYRQ